MLKCDNLFIDFLNLSKEVKLLYVFLNIHQITIIIYFNKHIHTTIVDFKKLGIDQDFSNLRCPLHVINNLDLENFVLYHLF